MSARPPGGPTVEIPLGSVKTEGIVAVTVDKVRRAAYGLQGAADALRSLGR